MEIKVEDTAVKMVDTEVAKKPEEVMAEMIILVAETMGMKAESALTSATIVDDKNWLILIFN